MLRKSSLTPVLNQKLFAKATDKVTEGINIMARKSSFSLPLKYPGIRDDLLRIFHQILETSRQDWENQESLPQNDTNRLSVLLQLVYISTSLASEPWFTIGLFLKNYDEALLVRDIFYAVEQVFQVAGVDTTCERYITCPKWSNFVQAIDRALQVM